MTTGTRATTTWLPKLLFVDGQFLPARALVCDSHGKVQGIIPADESTGDVRLLRNRALLPGLVNAHSHAFQRVIRGRTEYRTHERDSFWTWREMMYRAAERLSPEDIYDASRMAFLEMAASGITGVGEFHYLHNSPEGNAYDDTNLLSKQVVRAALDVGLRICLLRVAYARSGYQQPPNPRQRRFIEVDPQIYLKNTEELRDHLFREYRDFAWLGVAPHSVRAVPLDYLCEVNAWAASADIQVHMHVAEQPAEIESSLAEYGRTPVQVLANEGILSSRFTAVHAIHLTASDIAMLVKSRARICACPTTERNLGDGILPADFLHMQGLGICLGTDSQSEIDLLQDARSLEYHLRLQRLERVLISNRTAESGPTENEPELAALAKELFSMATINGAQSINAPAGTFEAGRPADFFTVDLHDPSIAGASQEDLLPLIVFSSRQTAIKEVAIAGKLIIEDGRHPKQDEIVAAFANLQRRLWGKSDSVQVEGVVA